MSIIVGRNNAGKSTIVEALRLVSVVTSRYENLRYRKVPDWLDIPIICRGVSPSLENLEINFDTVFHRYGEPPSEVKVEFEGGQTIKVYIGKRGGFHAVIRDQDGSLIKTKGQAKSINLPEVGILPQVAPLQESEDILTPEYVRGALSSALAPRHFRNQLNLLYDEHFSEFMKIAEATWPGLHIEELSGQGKTPGTDELSLLVRDDNFVAEVGWMGHGLQMWLQTMWFLARCKNYDTVILDEPDVYMHADLQRKLVRLLRGRHRQTIIATHSTEIMSEVESDEILIVDRKRVKSSFATSMPAVQQVVDRVGSVHNLQLARLWDARRVIFVEGEDLSILKHFQNALFPDSDEPIDIIPNMSIGGWGGWNYVIGSTDFIENAAGEEIRVYCILDSDYHTPDKIETRLEKAKGKNIQLHIWERKEIENYLVVPSAIRRVVARRMESGSPPTVERIKEQIDTIMDDMKNQVLDSLATAHQSENRGKAVATSNKWARSKIGKVWDTFEGRLSLVPGKKLLSRLSEWMQKEYSVSFGVNTLAKEIRPSEIHAEVEAVVRSIEMNESPS